MADALALGVAGRGAAEAAPQSLALAALRPPAAAREGYRQQPQAAHARRTPRSLAGQPPAACSPRRQRREGRGRGAWSRRLTANEARDCRHDPGTVANHRLQWAGRGSRRSPATLLVPACFKCSPPGMLFKDTGNNLPSSLCALRHCARVRLSLTSEAFLERIERYVAKLYRWQEDGLKVGIRSSLFLSRVYARVNVVRMRHVSELKSLSSLGTGPIVPSLNRVPSLVELTHYPAG